MHELYNRIRVLSLLNRYTTEELINILNKQKKDKQEVDKIREENQKRFEGERFEEKFKIALIYYIIETDRFDKLYKDKLDFAIEEEKQVYLPPDDIDQLLKDLNDNYNYDYYEAIKKEGPSTTDKIPSPIELINKFLPEFKKAKDFSISFYLN